MSTNVFVSEVELIQIVIIEEMPEGTVTDIVQKAGDTHKTLDVRFGRNVATRGCK